MNKITSENIHIWEGAGNKILIDFQFVEYKHFTNHPLVSANTLDDAVNILYQVGYRDSAQELNNHAK